MIKTLLFDNNGVITTDNEEQDLANLFSVALKDFNDPHKNIHAPYALGKTSLHEYLNQHKETFCSNHDIETIKKVHFDSYILIPETEEYLISLKGRFELAMLTNFGEGFDEANLKWQLEKIFDNDKIFVSSKVGLSKPNAKFYMHALNELQRKPGEVVFIDDRVENVEAAEAVGMKGIVFKDLDGFKAELNDILEVEKENA